MHLTWTSLFGVVSATSLLVLAVTGILLSAHYVPSGDLVTYDGGYGPLVGAPVSEAFDSTMTISFEVTAGLLLRQTHHWAALLLPASLVVQLMSTFFTGGHRRPRQLGWLLLVALFVLVMVGGWSGYALPDDMLSGTGLRIVQGVALGIPVVGTWVTTLLFGGEFPGLIIERLYAIHVYAVPAAIAAVVALRTVLAWRHGPTVPARAAATRSPGVPLWPVAALRALGMAGSTTGVLLLLGATSTISPVWSYGPADPGNAGAGSQPDWYMGLLDGALRLVPPGWEAEWLGYTWTFAVIVPVAVVGAWFVALAVYPFLEGWVTRDGRDHHVLERPRNVPVRTGLGVAGALVYGVVWGAASADVVAVTFGVSFEAVIVTLQVLLLGGPPLAFGLARGIAIGLQRKDRDVLLHGEETGRVRRTSDGGFEGVRAPVDASTRALLTTVPVAAAPVRRDRHGRQPASQRVRGALGRWFAVGHVRPVSPALPGSEEDGGAALPRPDDVAQLRA